MLTLQKNHQAHILALGELVTPKPDIAVCWSLRCEP